MRRQILSQILFVTLIAAPGFVASNASAALKTLHSFCSATNCTDGETPQGALVMDASGSLYGTTEVGGKHNNGLVFKLIPNAGKTKYTEHILKNFCAKPNCTDGSGPQSGLIMDADGNLYGTTGGGGKFGAGTVFKMKPLANGWSYAVIHSFCHNNNCTDGNASYTGLAYAGQASGQPYDGSSPLFGTTYVGGANNMGAVYELSPTGSGWNYKIIHSYSSGFHGGELLVDSSDNLFGTTLLGGANSGGTLYKLAADTWNETTLHNFGAEANFSDGWEPSGRLLMDGAGNLFGTTGGGGAGAHCTATHGCGVAFERKANGNYKVLHDFCSLKNCKDGAFPSSGVIMDSSGNLLGTTYEGGTGPGGTVFSLDRSNSWAETVLYDFCSEQNCTDGAGVTQPLIRDSSGNLFGTTGLGGANGSGGTVFRLNP
jgi:uncharacterized repeat protein (TIGR03803 family)